MLVGDAEFGAIVPEGSDDFELRQTDKEIILVDTKSTRAKARARTVSEDKKALRGLWDRPLKPGAVVNEYWLVTERSRTSSVSSKASATPLFQNQSIPSASRSFLVLEADPLQEAIQVLVERKNLLPLAAELVTLALAREIGVLANNNGPLALEDRHQLTTSDVERISARVLEAVDVERLEQVLRSGFLSPVDLATPLEDSGFYLGVDVEPGHFASGLALDRPEAVAQVLQGFERSRAVVVTGPSGSGKSGLMWNAVIASQLDRRWFRIAGTGVPDEEAMTAFFAAYSGTPIGLVVDDIGRGRLDVWETTRLRTSSNPDIVVLGSVRTEDAPLLQARHSISEILGAADAHLAKLLWTKLRDQNLTAWEGWNEPWARSNGLLLEYGHILTQGDRLDAIVLDQVRRRLSEQRDTELAILSASAPAAKHGGAVLISALRAYLDLSAADTARALERLVEEHLIRVDQSGTRLTGLHALRASAICDALAEIGLSTHEEQAISALNNVTPETLEPSIGGLVASGVIDENTVVETLLNREGFGHSLREMASSIRGVRRGALACIAKDWTATLGQKDIPPKLATLAAMFGAAPSADAGVLQLERIAEAGRELFSDVAARPTQPQLVSAIVNVLSSDSGGTANEIVDALEALSITALDSGQLEQLMAARPNLADFTIAEVVRVLDAAEAINPTISEAWSTKSSSNRQLVDRLTEETAFALPAIFKIQDDLLVVQADIFEAALEAEENPNDRLFDHAKAILRLVPSASVAHVRLVNAEGAKSLHMDAEKRIPRENAPPDAHSSANRHVMDAVAREVGGESWSAYLSRGEALMVRGQAAFRRLLDSMLVGRVNEDALNELNTVVTDCDSLIPPFETSDVVAARQGGQHLTPFQDVIFKLNAPLVAAIAKFPEDAPRVAAQVRDLIDNVGKAEKEPWNLVRDSIPSILGDVRGLLNDIEIIALEAAASRQSPQLRWPKANKKPKKAFSLVANGSRHAFTKRLETSRREIETTVQKELPEAKVIGPRLSDGNLWESRFIATFPIVSLDALRNWVAEASQIGARIASEHEESVDIALVPIIHGKAAVDLSFQLSRMRPNSIVTEMLQKIGRTNLLTRPASEILKRLDVPFVEMSNEFDGLFIAFRDIAGMSEFGLGLPGRPKLEQEKLENALELVETLGPELVSSFANINHPAFEKLRLVLQAMSGESEAETELDQIEINEWHDAQTELLWNAAAEDGT
jgi:RecA/RadA recombinase